MSEAKTQGNPLQQGAMFMAGLTLLQSLRVALTGAKFALDRFKIPQQHASSFINMVHNPMELATFTGIFLINALTWTGGWFNGCAKYFAAVTNMTLCCSFILLLFAFTSGGSLGNLTFYYWAIVFASFIYGLNVACVMNVGSASAAFFSVGMPISGIQVCIYYYVFTKLAEWHNWSNVSYWVIVWQLIIAIVIAAVSASVWIAVAVKGGANNNSGADAKQAKDTPTGAWSPILMAMVGMGGIYAFYPAIAPYKLTDVGTGYTVDLVVLFVSAVPSLVIAALCSYSETSPDRPWTSKNTAWHFTWILAIPHLTAMILCLVTLHYPGSGLATSIKSSGLKVGVITVTLKFCEEGLKAVSYAGAGKQVGKYCTKNCREDQCGCSTGGGACKCCCKCDEGSGQCKPSECKSKDCKCCKENEDPSGFGQRVERGWHVRQLNPLVPVMSDARFWESLRPFLLFMKMKNFNGSWIVYILKAMAICRSEERILHCALAYSRVFKYTLVKIRVVIYTNNVVV
ncbi:hypothetical protein BEWA_022300 [Theileria equi strain WA]|uniref:Uncharacterized protein n=1 Tax=Theileria equi strain WA TaxID=1537102 RepID=L0AUW1_THEEQ|nr:hypothetical protein BEWA_022300 [Theileria equi strain WA]AFZ79382.1 hypothetical protein BEWA_022300 [Theileria equi strain WA]|eukprot:XP_004829048.1 hypothetical protein BEWA_022300 [Theileria equi strain WA]